MDFTLDSYKTLLSSLLAAGYRFVTYSEYLQSMQGTLFVILRHDVDLLPYNSLATAKIEAEMGIRATYFFRAVPESWNEEVIKGIVALDNRRRLAKVVRSPRPTGSLVLGYREKG